VFLTPIQTIIRNTDMPKSPPSGANLAIEFQYNPAGQIARHRL
jgi:hypothetical protein